MSDQTPPADVHSEPPTSEVAIAASPAFDDTDQDEIAVLQNSSHEQTCHACGAGHQAGHYCSQCGGDLKARPSTSDATYSQFRLAAMAVGLVAGGLVIVGALLPWGTAGIAFLTIRKSSDPVDIGLTIGMGLLVIIGALAAGLTARPRRAVALLGAGLVLLAAEVGAASYALYWANESLQNSIGGVVQGGVTPGPGIYLLGVGLVLVLVAGVLVTNAMPNGDGVGVGVIGVVLLIAGCSVGVGLMDRALHDKQRETQLAATNASSNSDSYVTESTQPTYTALTDSPSTEMMTTTSTTVFTGDTLAAAESTVLAKGYSPTDTSDYNSSAAGNSGLHVIIGTHAGSATGRGQVAFFFNDGKYLGTDSTSESAAIQMGFRTDNTITLEYQVYRASDPMCCPSMGATAVRFEWNGHSLVNLDPLPPSDNEDGTRW